MSWTDFVHNGATYPLDHLAPSRATYPLPAAPPRPSDMLVSVKVTYSHHCFTGPAGKKTLPNSSLFYPAVSDRRLFNFTRHAESYALPRIISSLHQRDCFYTDKKDHATLAVSMTNRGQRDYAVFFILKKAHVNDASYDAYLTVTSAYVKPGYKPSGKVRFIQVLVSVL